MKENQIKYIIAAAAVVLFGVLWMFTGQKGSQGSREEIDIFSSETDSADEEKADLSKGKIYVHITGAVKKPGVYIFEKKPRVIEVVEKAGGFKKNAATSGINQAELVEDGTQIVIEKRGGTKTTGRDDPLGQEQRDGSVLIDINTAAREQLMTLDGIGESKAMAIIAYREEHGRFKKIEDIMNITGIKDGVFDKIKSQIRVS
jgi:competence protein ComEA